MRSVESCPYREPRPSGDASCRLLPQIAGLEDLSSCRVGRDACSACCASEGPSPVKLNPVVASLLSHLADEVISVGGRPGCSPTQAAVLREWAHQHLRVEFPRGTTVSLPKRTSEPCFYLGGPETEDSSEALYSCRHANHSTTTPDRCHLCRDWADRSGPAPRPLGELLPRPSTRHGPRVERWAVGMTTAPRREPTVDWSLDSLARAGWMEPRLFQDTPVGVAPRWTHLPTTVRDARIGAWPNFFLGLMELLLREPDADAYLMIQDDVLFYDREDLRAYLETMLWPSEPAGLVSLYASAAYDRPGSGWHAHTGAWVWGALAFVFPRALAQRFVSDPSVLEHRWSGPRQGLAHIDVVIGHWADRHEVPIHYPCPSLTQHMGDVSTLWRTAQALGPRRAGHFLGDLTKA